MSENNLRDFVVIDSENLNKLKKMINSKTITSGRRKLIQILILMHEGHSDKQIAKIFGWNTPYRAKRIRAQFITHGLAKLVNLPKNHRRHRYITQEACQWVLNIAKQKPSELKNGPHIDKWSIAKLTVYIRNNCIQAGHPCLSVAVKSTIWNILNQKDSLDCTIKS